MEEADGTQSVLSTEVADVLTTALEVGILGSCITLNVCSNMMIIVLRKSIILGFPSGRRRQCRLHCVCTEISK